MSIEEQISQLVHKYEGLDARRLKQFNEENTKKDFILPLFRHLGWDVGNSDEVAAEEKSSNGRVDYAFKIGGVSKFYLEAKPLREDLNQRPDWAKQVITYAENKGVTWAVLTNFKQLMVFNAEWDKPALERARFLNLTYQEYLFIYFSKTS
jgi:predicted type IV restriction endonuclease